MIKHASIYESRDRSADEEGLRVLVMRQWPRGIRKESIDLWVKDAGPSRELLQALHAGLPWAEFDRRYRLEMLDDRAEVLLRLRDLEREHGVLTLLCHERMPPAEHCHREVLLDLLSTSSEPAAPVGGTERSR